MFQKACKDALATVMPIVVAWRTKRSGVECSIGAGMILNEEGWFITAGHILDQITKLDHEVTSPTIRKGHRNSRITNYAVIFGPGKARLDRALVVDNVDFGVGKLEAYTPPKDHRFPRLRIKDVEQGELLCRVGYPFFDGIDAKWTTKKGFTFTNLFPVPMFANEALVSRFAQLKEGRWIETSSPGLKGQSGGPLIDTDSLVCGIQVNTHHYPLGFEGKGRNQVLNVGRAIHVETIRGVLDKEGIEYFRQGADDD